ncbi:MAG: hypothetical protein ACOYON_02240 [Fimbriimonas sp.]
MRFNAPGLSHVEYRVATFPTFREHMVRRIAGVKFPIDDAATQDSLQDYGPQVLAGLTTRDADDPTIALIDAWSVTADVLTFYQERIANEGFLRTATERFSVLELAREIGYELNPGSAATAYLAFEVESIPNTEGQQVVKAHTRVLTIPEKGELPQTYETAADVEVRVEWNRMLPQVTTPQILTATTRRVFVQGNPTEIRVGDPLLLVVNESDKAVPKVWNVSARLYDDELKVTTLELENPPVAAPNPPRFVVLINILPMLLTTTLNATHLKTVFDAPYRDRHLGTMFKMASWNKSWVTRHAPVYRAPVAPAPPPAPKPEPYTAGAGLPVLPNPEVGIFAFRHRTGVFGHNAPAFKTLAADLKTAWSPDWDANPRFVTQRSDQETYQEKVDGHPTIFLEREVTDLDKGQWVVLRSLGVGTETFRVANIITQGVAEFGMSGRATGLRLVTPEGKEPKSAKAPANNTLKFETRSTTVYSGSYALPLAPLRVTSDLGKGTPEHDSLTLEELILDLVPGRPVIISGERSDLHGVRVSETLFLKDIVHYQARTTLVFTTDMQYKYRRETVSLSANVVVATHGETLAPEILGHGDGGRPNQTFELRKPPLTYVPAENSTGSATTLEIRVNGILWHEAPSLYALGPEDRGYVVRISDDGKPRVIFGDGTHGARIPTGVNNVVAYYRTGIGTGGCLRENRLTLLPNRPAGIRGVRNPIETEGGVNPESRDEARSNAPQTVLTFGRIVSRKDLEDFARSFAGIGKSQAIEVQRGEKRWLLLTVGGIESKPLAKTDSTFMKLESAIRAQKEPAILVRVESYQPQFFRIKAKLRVDSDRISTVVLDAARDRLIAGFSFENRGFGQQATLAEAVALIQNTPGVIAVDVEEFRLVVVTGSTPILSPVLVARRATWTGADPVIAEVLTISPLDIELEDTL